MKKFSFILSAVLTIFSGLSFGFSGGDGTPGNPYKISTKSDIEAVNHNLTAHYILVNDINLSGHTYTAAVISEDLDNMGYGFQGTSFNDWLARGDSADADA